MLAFLFCIFVLVYGVFFNSSWWLILLSMLFIYPLCFFFNLNYSFLSKSSLVSLDYFSFLMLVLTFWIVFLCFFSSIYLISHNFSLYFLFMMGGLMFFLIMFFILSNFFLFFFFFEATLFPTLFIILGWGNNFERLSSGFYLFFYTLFSSMPMMFSIFFFSEMNNTLEFLFMEMKNSFNLIYFMLVISFLVKMPMFLVHSWLPKAHVEAPVSGSMILAGVLLKMGGYGIFRLSFLYKYFLSLNVIWIYISIWGGILSSMICMRQVDLKSLIAFSSISHMSLVIIGLVIYSNLGVIGSLMLMVAHGLCSSGMFYLANVVYERSGTRSIFLNKGLMSIYPSLSLWWFLLCSFNMAAPPSLNLISEIFLIGGLVSWSFSFVFFLMLISFLGGAYNLFLFSFTNHGKLFSGLHLLNPCYIREFLILFLHIFPIFVLFLKLDFFY
uniref:NADH dehydrogenase subunit 4 n=1 Tax=Mycterothrips gongshanensis TaxID=2792509 RepID=UPI00220D1140|nr:NADH dehydrogenase subunit 4 [Mycterothrips gongshanensis]UXW64200.1 NADH dehydrogenase subunit 4 [Mycterothrips gongshanensis]